MDERDALDIEGAQSAHCGGARRDDGHAETPGEPSEEGILAIGPSAYAELVDA
jgi:hypothetical protein